MQKESIHKTEQPLRSLTPTAISGFVGYSMVFAWFLNIILLYHVSPNSGEPVLHFWQMRLVTILVIVVVFLLLSRFSEKIETTNFFLINSAFVGLAIALNFCPVPDMLNAVMTAVGFAGIASLWDFYLKTQGKPLVYYIGGFALSGCLVLIVTNSDFFVWQILYAVLPGGALLLFFSLLPSLQKDPSFPSPRKRPSKKGVLKPSNNFVYQLLNGYSTAVAACGLSALFGQEGFSYSVVGSRLVAIAMIFGAIHLTIDISKNTRIDQTTVSKFSLIGIIPCILLIPFVPDWADILCFCILLYIAIRHAAFGMHRAVEIARQNDLSNLYVLSLFRAMYCLGLLLGWGFAGYAFILDQSSVGEILFCFISLYFIAITIAFFLLKKQNLSVVDYKETDRGHFKRKVSKAAEMHSLTSRQEEILLYLAKGRQAEFIAEKLVISRATAKSHIYAIYQKMGIHSQHEIMDFVENITFNDHDESSF